MSGAQPDDRVRPPRLARAFLRWSVARTRRDDVDADLVEELEARASAGSARAARRWYRRQSLDFCMARLRGVTLGRGRASLLRPTRWVAASDIRVAVRQARRQPLASLTAILALAAAIGLSVAVFMFARGIVWPQLPAPEGTSLYMVRVQRPAEGPAQVRPTEVALWREATTVLSIGAFDFISPPLSVGGEIGTPVDGARVTAAAFARISPPPLVGRNLTEADAEPGAEAVVVLGERLWRTRWAADANVVGRTVRIGRDAHTIVGVLPGDWRFPATQELWLPLPLRQMADEDEAARVSAPTTPGFERLFAWVVVDDRIAPEVVATELTGLARRLPSVAGAAETTASVVPYADGLIGGNGSLIAAAVLAALLAFLCGVSLNVANLVLARGAARAGELSVRVALGASRARIATQMFVEALVIGGMAALVGMTAARLGVDWLAAQVGNELPFWMDLSVGPAVVLFAAAAAVGASALAGIAPALRLTRRPGVGAVLQSASSRAAAMPGRLATVLLVGQLALSLGFLSLAGLLVEGLWDYTRAPVVASSDRIVTATLYRDPALSGSNAAWGSPELHTLRMEIEAGLRAIPGAVAAAVSLGLPRANNGFGQAEVEDVGGNVPPVVRVQTASIGPGFFETLAVTPSRGRTFSEADARPESPRVAVVSERFVSAAFGDGSPLGRRFRWLRGDGETSEWVEVVGVVPDLDLDPGDRSARGEVYSPLVGSNFLHAAVRAAGDPLSIAPALRQVVGAVDPTIRVTDMQRLVDVGWEARVALGAGGTALLALGGMALLLSLAGIYALTSLLVTSRTREIGIRVALGASRRSVLGAVLRRSLVQLVGGTIGGLGLAFVFQRLTAILPFSIPGRLTVAIPLLAGAMLVAGLIASWVPARRALGVDPVEALRRD